MLGDTGRSRLVQGAFDIWFRANVKNGSSSEWHRQFKEFRYGFQDGEMALEHESDSPAYNAGWEAGSKHHG